MAKISGGSPNRETGSCQHLEPIINHIKNGINYFTIKLLIVGNFLQSSCWGPNSILSSHIADFIAKIMFEKIYKMRTFPKFVVQL